MPQDGQGRWLVQTDRSELWMYTLSESYEPGEIIHIHASSTICRSFQIDIVRDGKIVHTTETISVDFHKAPTRAFETGCGWPEVYQFKIPNDWPSGFYIMNGRCVGPNNDAGLNGPALAEHFFVLRPSLSDDRNLVTKHINEKRILLICSTNTWTSYNNWGGANHYASFEKTGNPRLHYSDEGFQVPMEEIMAGNTILSNCRPYSPGMVTLPDGYPRLPYSALNAPSEINNASVIRNMISLKGVDRGVLGGQQKASSWCQSTGWASYERYFYEWAVKDGYKVDMISNRDLHRYGRKILDHYKVCVCIGHDEYWSSGMRDEIDGYLDDGGRVARFAGNFYWQIRYEADPNAPKDGPPRQICHKYGAAKTDPVMGTKDQHLLTYEWESPLIGRPGCETFGLNGAMGLYARWLRSNPANPGGFTIYRPQHWALKNSGLCYGDMLGGAAQDAVIFGFECDGLDYRIDDGVPFPTGNDGANVEATRIIGIGLCDNSGLPGDQRLNAAVRYGKTPDELAGENLSKEMLKRAERGNGMIVEFYRGKGRVFHVGSTEWIVGLQQHRSDPTQCKSKMVEVITQNVLNRFLDIKPFGTTWDDFGETVARL